MSVLTYHYIIPYVAVIEPTDPLLSYVLAISDKAIYTVRPEKRNELSHEFHARIITLWKKAERQFKCNAFIVYAQHKDIDIELIEPTVCADHAENQILLYRKEEKYNPVYYVEIKGILGKEPLLASDIGAIPNGSGQRIC